MQSTSTLWREKYKILGINADGTCAYV